MENPINEIPNIVKDLYQLVNKLENNFPGRKFTLDGHLVGSIGEVLVADKYGLELLPPSAKKHDAITSDGKLVQIKATQAKSVALRSEPDYLIVIKLLKNGTFEVFYNGKGEYAWEQSGKMQSNGQQSISLTKLALLMTKYGNSIESIEEI